MISVAVDIMIEELLKYNQIPEFMKNTGYGFNDINWTKELCICHNSDCRDCKYSKGFFFSCKSYIVNYINVRYKEST